MVPEKKDTNKLTILAFKIIPLLHNTRLATLIKLLETVMKGLFRSRSQNPVKRPCLSKKFGEWYQKTNKKEDKN
jgi:hypothetical protein